MMQPSPAPGNFFPPGLAVRPVQPADNEAVRALFIAGQKELAGPGSAPNVRIAIKRYTDACLMDDLARASVHYSKPGRRMWVLESQQHEVAAIAAIDSMDSTAGVALFTRLVVAPQFRRKGVARLLTRRAEQWAVRQGYSMARLEVTDLQPVARAMYVSLGYVDRNTSYYGPITVFEMEKSLLL